jgi:spore coat polysaccharide biosynthesis predicted glycosyltransferase SpsG
LQLLRVDFSSEIGFGHLKRATNLCKDCKIVCINCDEKYTDLPLIKVKNNEEFFEIVEKLKPKEVIVDNYEFSLDDEKRFKKLFPDVKLICFDDYKKEHYCDEVISVDRCRKDVKILKNKKKKYYKRKGTILSIGATDIQGLIFKILKQIKNIEVYTTSANPNLAKLKRYCKIRKIPLFIDKSLKEVMKKKEFAIITPSTISIEAIDNTLPFIAIKTVKNQDNLARCLKKKGYFVIDKRDIYKLKRLYPIWKRKTQIKAKRGYYYKNSL